MVASLIKWKAIWKHFTLIFKYNSLGIIANEKNKIENEHKYK